MYRYTLDLKAFVYASFGLARQAFTLGCKIRIAATTFCLSQTNTSDLHNPDIWFEAFVYILQVFDENYAVAYD